MAKTRVKPSAPDSPAPALPADEAVLRRRREVLHWRLLGATFGQTEHAQNVESITADVASELGLPGAILDPAMGIDTLVQRYPELKNDFAAMEAICKPSADEDAAGATDAPARPTDGPLTPGGLRRSFAYAKLVLNVFGPTTRTTTVTAQQYHQWTRDCDRFEACFGYGPGSLRGKKGGGTQQGHGKGKGDGDGKGTGGAGGSSGGASATGTGSGHHISEESLRAGLQGIEGDLIRRMALREVLKDDQMAGALTPSMPLVEQLLRDKANLSGNALKNAKALIKQYVDQLAEVLRLQVMRAVKGKLDRSVPPKRVFRNLDLKRTVWKNLPNYNPRDGRLYVDRLFYKQTAKKSTPIRMIVVVDQSGSMVDAMVQCTILASIFAGLPRVDMHLLAFDTRVLDLTPWVDDPFEVLLRTELGGGTLIKQALEHAAEKIEEPRNTAVVLISDFFEGGSNQELLDTIKAMRDSGVHFIPVGAVTSGGYFSVAEFFRTKLKEMGMPILTGNIRKLIEELKKLL